MRLVLSLIINVLSMVVLCARYNMSNVNLCDGFRRYRRPRAYMRVLCSQYSNVCVLHAIVYLVEYDTRFIDRNKTLLPEERS